MPPLRLPDFASAANLQTAPTPLVEEGTGTLAAYEDGYKAGWEDAAAAQSDAKAATEADVARHLQGMTYGHDEARAQILQAIEPLLIRIAGSVLPEMARVSLAPMLVEVLLPLVANTAATPLRLRTAPDTMAVVEAYLSRQPDLSFEIVPDASLTTGCVHILRGPVELHLDLDGVTATVLQTMQTFFQSQTKERQDAG